MWRRDVVSLVERGWRGARDASVIWQARGLRVTHLIKGSLDREHRALIRPYPNIRLVPLPRAVFRAAAWVWLIALGLLGRMRWVVLDHERTLRSVQGWCRLIGAEPILVHEEGDSCRLRMRDRLVTAQELS